MKRINYKNELFKIALEDAYHFSPLNNEMVCHLSQAYLRTKVEHLLNADPSVSKTHDPHKRDYGVQMAGPIIAIIFRSGRSMDECREIYQMREREQIRREVAKNVEKVEALDNYKDRLDSLINDVVFSLSEEGRERKELQKHVQEVEQPVRKTIGRL